MLRPLIFSLLMLAAPASESFMSVECLPQKGLIKAFVKLRYNDFVFDYRFIINDDQHFDPAGKIDTTEILVRRYLDARILVFADDKRLKTELTNIESANDELRLDFICHFNKRAKHFRVKNLMLTEYKDYHSNHLIFKYRDFEEGVTLTSKKPEQTFNVRE